MSFRKKERLTSDVVKNELQEEAVEDMVEDDSDDEKRVEELPIGALSSDTETGVLKAMTGVVGGTPTWTTVGTAPGGGFITTHPSTTTWPTPAIPGYPSTTGPKSKRRSTVRLPSRFTEKVLLAFLEEDQSEDEKNDVVWAANLAVERVEMTLENGETKLVVVLSLEDKYGNNPDPD